MSNQEEEKKTNKEDVVLDKVHFEDNQQRISSSRIGRYIHGVLTVASFLILFAIVIVLHFKLKDDYDTLRAKVDLNAKNELLERINYMRSIQEQMDRKLNNSEHSVRRYVNLLMKNSTDSKLRWLREEKSDKVRGTNHQLNTSLERVKEAVNSLIPTLEYLKLNLTSLTNSSDSKMRRFGRVVEKLKDRLVLAQNDLTHLNVSLHTELTKASNSTASSIENVRKELSTFSNFTASKIGQMITDMNNTNINIVNMWEMFSRHNSSLHSHIWVTFTALASKVKDADEKLVNLRNFTAKELWKFRNDLNNTQESLGRARSEFVYFNRSIHSLLEGVGKSHRMSVQNTNEKIRSFRKDFEDNKKLAATEGKSINDKLSDTKEEFRESLKEENEDTSSLEKKMTSKQENLEKGQRSLQDKIAQQQKEIKRLRNTVNEMKNKASGYQRVNVPLILCVLVLASIFTLK